MTDEVKIPGKRITTGCSYCGTQLDLVFGTMYRSLSKTELCYHIAVQDKQCHGCGEIINLIEITDKDELDLFFDWYNNEAAPLIPRIKNRKDTSE